MAEKKVEVKFQVNGAKATEADIKRISGAFGNLNTAVANVAHWAGALGAMTAAVGATVGGTIRMADSVTTLNNQLKLATGSTALASQAYGALFDVAQRSRVSFTELGATYAAIARAGGEMGISQQRLLKVTESIANAMTIGGGSAESMKAALVQLGQGLASGTLRGEELNSIMEQTPRLARALADGMGIPIGQLRTMGAEGKITAQAVIEALEKAGPQLMKEVASASMTVGQAMTALHNSTANMIGQLDQASSASYNLASAVQSVSGGVDALAASIGAHQAAFGIFTNGALGAAGAAGVALLIPGLREVRVAIAGIGAVIGGAVGLADWLGSTDTAQRASVAQLDNQIKLIEQRTQAGKYGSAAERADAAVRLQGLKDELAALQQKMALKEGAALTGSNDVESRRLQAHTGAQKAQAALQVRLNALLQAGSGVSEAYTLRMREINDLHTAGVLVGKQYAAALDAAHKLLKKPPESEQGKQAKKDAQEAAQAQEALRLSYVAMAQARADARNKEGAEIEAYLAQERLAGLQQASAAEAALVVAQAEFDNHGKLRSAIEQTTLARLRDQQAGLSAGTEAYDNLQRQITAQEGLIKVLASGEVRAANEVAAKDAADKWKSAAQELHQDVKGALSAAFRDSDNPLQAFGDALGNVVYTRMTSAAADAMATALVGMASSGDKGLFGSLLGAFGFAKGDVFERPSPSLSAYSGGVYDSPKLFKFASGAGVFAEAGPEAIMPLARGPNGKLGVQATGGSGGNSMVVNIIESPGNGGQQSRRSENGVDILDVFVERVKSAIAGDISRGSGAVPSAMTRTYGLNRVAGAY